MAQSPTWYLIPAGTIPSWVRGHNPISRLENAEVAGSKWQRNDWEVGSCCTQKPPLLLGRDSAGRNPRTYHDLSAALMPRARWVQYSIRSPITASGLGSGLLVEGCTEVTDWKRGSWSSAPSWKSWRRMDLWNTHFLSPYPELPLRSRGQFRLCVCSYRASFV